MSIIAKSHKAVVRCRVCGHSDAESLGKIADCGEFAGQHISPPIKGGGLWLCKDCGSMFRHPTLSANDYISLYEQAPSTVWVDNGVERNDFTTIYAYLKSNVGDSILDVGCYTGNFLVGVSNKFKKFGIEPSDLASREAASKGISILGKTLNDLDSDQVFDVVVAIDVIEHVLDVENFLSQALAHVKENGLLVISTGNPGCFFWRKVFKSRFWYNYFAEHVTFPSYKYYIDFSNRLGLQIPEQIRFKYLELKPVIRLSMLLRYSISQAIQKAMKMIRCTAVHRIHWFAYVSLIGAFTDHHVIIFRKSKLC